VIILPFTLDQGNLKRPFRRSEQKEGFYYMDPDDQTIETQSLEAVPSYVEQQAAEFVLFCDALEIDAQPDDDMSSH
jgi:hypothetical protein